MGGLIRADNLVTEHAAFIADVGFDRQRFVEIFVVILRQSSPVRIGGMNVSVQPEDRLFRETVLCKNGGIGRKAAEQHSKEKHCKRDTQNDRNDHRLEHIIEAILETDQQV